ncbi:medium-chain acyl-CoA ligase ACSF2, mitochondrial-like [Uranotaenia lowii]|uniref:medium-chain acyl-CoA ligase ACSF2, mitochondrial-like n=1 Tax=Uranotaenia lowii TaxID=190385 RepID=UPI002479198A|nr:medium-chain acyl-CoA ligase ACSF2, mitochondrial-like [Uranotaenia lowii]
MLNATIRKCLPQTSSAIGYSKRLAPGNFTVASQSRSVHRTATNHEDDANLSYYHKASTKPLLYRTIGQQIRLTAEKYPNNEALISRHEERKFTYSDVLEKADKIAASFFELGLQRGDRVAILAPNVTEHYLTLLGAYRAGMIAVGINPASQLPELEYALNLVQAKALITIERFKTQNYLGMIEQLIPELPNCSPGKIKSARVPSLSTVIMNSSKKTPGIITFDDLQSLPQQGSISDIERLQTTIDPDSGANLLFTSGTTGKPKAALLSHFGILNNAEIWARRAEMGARDHRICLQVPMFHVFGLTFGVVCPIFYGTSIVLPAAGFNSLDSLEAIQKDRCSILYGTPTMYVDMMNELRKTDMSLPPVDLALVGAAACSPQLLKDIGAAFKLRKVCTGYGMTEMSGSIFNSDRRDTTESMLDTVGLLVDHLEAKIVDKTGQTVPFGTPGELLIRGYVNMLGYWNQPDKTKETIGEDRWLKTGDQFVLNPNGYAKVVGRLKELIIRGGENIYPKEIEDVLNTHPSILESHCIGVPDERLGEEVCAYVRLMDNAKFDMAELKSFCQGKIAHFKVPRHLRITELFPRTASGKVQKFKLLELFTAEKNKNS